MNPAGLALAGAGAAVAAAINSAAGGGSFISFPTLVFLGMPPITANATNTAAMWIGQVGSIGGFRDDMVKPTPRFFVAMIVSAFGGIAGALLLLHTPAQAFNAVIPWLLLFATLVFALAPWLLTFARRTTDVEDVAWWHSIVLFVIAIYGGYFGGGQGLVILAFLALIGMTSLRKMNALKSVLAFINNGVPVIPFVFAHALAWDVAIVMCVCATIGGYYGAVVVKRVPPRIMRITIVCIGAATTAAFFLRRH
jgi:uncharacterized membrane protein YfcA